MSNNTNDSLSIEGSNKNSLLQIDHEAFKANFGRTPFKIRHNLADHPILTIPALIELSKKLPPHHVKFNSGEIPVGTRLYTGTQTGLSAVETLDRIEEAKSWMVLKYVEADPAYRELMDACLNEVQVFSEKLDRGMVRREAYIFVTSPNCFTAWHMDPEHSFLLQVRGSKTMYVQSNSMMRDKDWEDYFELGTVPPHKEEYRQTAAPHHITRGEGLHVPVTVPHWVINGPEASVSFSVTFRTRAVERRAVVYAANAFLRNKGLKPTSFGKSIIVDTAKDYAFRTVRRARRVLGDKNVSHSGKY